MSLLESQEKEKRLLESLAWGPVSDGFYGSDLYFDLFQDRYGTPGQGFFVPISILSDRKGGGNWPLWRNEFELAQYRQRSRIICRKNSYARSLLFNLQTHIIGKGFTYEIQAKEERDAAPEPGVQPNAQDDELVTRTQKFVDQFLMANRFTASVNPDPDSSLVTSSREWETARRMYRDGEGILRLFHCEDDNFRGMTFVRFVEPEQVTDPPQTGAEHGWSYGMRHQTDPFEDEEDIREYYVKYKDGGRDGQEGEHVPASEIVHLKNLEEDAATKRGLPAFSLDMVDALERASKLMRNVSTSSGVRAATAEIWQHENSSEAQVQSMATRMAERQSVNPITGRIETQERTRPGSTRRIPAGQKPVWPQAVGASEHLEVLQGDLRQAGIVFAAPEYMTGDASNANYSSTKEAGAPFVIASEVTQNHFKTAFMIVVLKAIKWAVKCGILPENTLDVVELQVTAPTISVRDPLQTAQEDQILIGAKIKSVKTCQSERGLDPDHEAANNEEFDAKFGQQGGALPMPGDDNLFGGGGPDNGPPAGPQSGGGGQPPLANFSLESAELLEAGDSLPPGFTGEHDDSLGRKRYYSQGKLVKGPEDVVAGQKQQGGNKATAPAQIHGAGIDPANVTKEDVNRRIADLSNKPMHPSQVANEVMTSGKWFKAMAASGDAYQRANAETLFGTTLKKAEESGVKIEQLFGKDHPQLAQFKRMIDLAPISQGSGFDLRTQGGERTPGYQHNPAGVTKAQEEAAKVRKLMGLESRDVLENFTGVDAHGHHWQDGKQIAAPKDSPSSPDKHVAGPTAIDQTHHDHPKAPELAAQAVKLWGSNAKAKLEEAIAKHAENPDPAIQRKVMAAKVALAGLAKQHDLGDFDLGKEFAEVVAKEVVTPEPPTKKEESKSKSEEWSAIKSPEDAKAWAKGSVVKQTLYHGTHADVADKIKASGFQPGMSAFGMGVYLSADKSFADSYQRGAREGKGRTLEAKIDVKKMLPIKDSPQGYEAAAKSLGMSKAEFASETQKTMPSTKGSQLLAMGEVIRKAAQSQGYDGLDVDSSKPFYVVFDPKRVTTIAEEPAPLAPAPNAPPPHPESVVKAKPLGKIEDAATLDAAHDHVKKLYESALTDDKIFEKVDAAMASLGNELTVPQLKTLAGKFGINDVRGSKADIIGSIGRKIKSRREMHDRTKAHGEASDSSPGIDSHAAALKHAMTVNYPEDGWTRAKTDEVMKQFADLSKSDLVSIAAKSGAVKPNEEKDWNRKSAKAIREDLADILNAGVRAFERVQA